MRVRRRCGSAPPCSVIGAWVRKARLRPPGVLNQASRPLHRTQALTLLVPLYHQLTLMRNRYDSGWPEERKGNEGLSRTPN
jgi:hypothetical protein